MKKEFPTFRVKKYTFQKVNDNIMYIIQKNEASIECVGK